MLAFNELETGMLARKNCPPQSPWLWTEKLPPVDGEPRAQGGQCLVTVRQQVGTMVVGAHSHGGAL